MGRDGAEEGVGVEVERRVEAGRGGGHALAVAGTQPAVLTVALRHDAVPLAEADRLHRAQHHRPVAQIEAQLHVPVRSNDSFDLHLDSASQFAKR